MRLILVRHGHAGRKVDWHQPDERRPLTPAGRTQAARLIEVVMPLQPTRIISSPHIRCLETAEPLSDASDLKVERCSDLVPDAPAKALGLVRRLCADESADGVVIVTHGEVMGEVLRKLGKEDGVRLEHRPPGLKGCVWTLEFAKGKLLEAHYIPPR